MRKLVLILLIAIFSTSLFGQNENSNVQKDKKTPEKTELKENFLLTKQLLENKNFVLETNELRNQYGYQQWVSPNVNFIKVNNENAVIQIGSEQGIGYNGVGGITAEGKITSWELNANNDKKTFGLSISVLTNIGSYDLNFRINPYGQATARLTGVARGSLVFEGDLVALANSAVFEGQTH